MKCNVSRRFQRSECAFLQHWYSGRMSKSESAEAKDWIVGLEPGTWFWSQDVPGRRGIAHPVLSRLSNDDASGVQRVAKGLYWRGWPEGHDLASMPPDYTIAALLLAGSGAGLADWDALNRLRWSTQVPCKAMISTLGPPPKPPHPTVIYKQRNNQRRAELNWSEVTVLEALGMLWMTEALWHECLESIHNGRFTTYLRWGLPIRANMLEWAAETEEDMTVESLHQVGEVAAAINKAEEAA